MKRIYLDYASITPLDKRVLKSMEPYLTKNFYNPSSLYEEGRIARSAIEMARKSVAHILQSKPSEVFFTGSGTESNNIAIQGVIEAAIKNKKSKEKIHVITSSVEHSSILEIFKNFETKGVEVTYIEVDENGLITHQKVIDALKKNTVLISLMYGNNEIGTINNISKISKLVSKIRKEKKLNPVIIHTDACQGACYLNIRSDYLGADLITLDGSKLYGPRGSGVLYKKRGTPFVKSIFGGGQEDGVRSGTENTASIVGFGKALEICQKEKNKESNRLKKLQSFAFEILKSNIPNLIVNGSENERLPNNINFCVQGIDSEFSVIKLDLLGISCSSVTTCKNLMDDSSSYVVAELDKSRNLSSNTKVVKWNCGRSSLRLSIGRFTTKKELERALKIIMNLLKAK